MKQLVHGGDWMGYRERFGRDALDFSANVSPLGLPEGVAQAIRDGKITFFVARRGYRAVGMCSISRCFSTFACTDVGIFDDFYIEPVFRKKGAARLLAQAAQEWSKENALASLTVTCAPCDEGMYQALGFDTHLGNTFAYLR